MMIISTEDVSLPWLLGESCPDKWKNHYGSSLAKPHRVSRRVSRLLIFSLNQIKRQLCFVFAIQTERWWKFLFVLLHFYSSSFFLQPRRFRKTAAFHWLSLVDTIHITGKILLKHRHRHFIWEGFKHITVQVQVPKHKYTNTHVLSSAVRIQNSLWLLS